MKHVARDLLAAWLVLLLALTGLGLAAHDGRLAGQPLWTLCGGGAPAAVPAPDAPAGPHPCLDCLAPVLAATAAPAPARAALPFPFVAVRAAGHAAPPASPAHLPAIRAPPVPA